MSEPKFDYVVFIGRLEPPTKAHLAIALKALEFGKQLIVVLGSAFQARNPKNPFLWTERRDMLLLSLPEEVRDRVRVEPMRDYFDDERWARKVRELVGAIAKPGQSIALIGHKKDASSIYLDDFPGWPLIDLPRLSAIDATHVRNAYFEGVNADAELAICCEYVPSPVVDYLRAWRNLPYYDEMVFESKKLASDKAKYGTIAMTADAVIECGGRVLLVKRKHAPGRGLWAIPGGFTDRNESTFNTAIREADEETNIGIPASTMRRCLVNSFLADHPDRSLRGRVYSHVFHFRLKDGDTLPEVQAGDDAETADWIHKDELPSLEGSFHDDHFQLLDRIYNFAQ